MATLISVGTGLIGTLVGAAIAWFAGRRQHRVETTYAMHQEFHGAEMTKSRGLAGETVREHKAKNYDELRRDLPLEKTQHVWNVLYFYQRLWFAIKYENIQKNKVPVMFGENFWWWYLNSYQEQLKPEKKAKEKEKEEEEEEEKKKKEKGLNWQAARDIEELWNWMKKEADPSDQKRWHERAMEMADALRREQTVSHFTDGPGRPAT